MAKEGVISVCGFLIHISHYDPTWCKVKSREKPFDLDLGLEIIDTMSEVGLNLLVIDCADGVRYKSHPELARKYTVPMTHLEELVNRAQEKDIEVVPKLNFSQSRHHQHNDWFRPHNDLFDNDNYWRIAFEIIDEIIQVCRPRRYFHIGMDEDHDRAHSQYIEAILKLQSGLKERGLRTIIWNDSSHGGKMLVHAEKSLVAEKKIPKDIVQVLWDYSNVQPKIIRRLIKEGFQVWGAPGPNAEKVLKWREAILHYGGKGLLLTMWIPCSLSNRSKLIQFIRTSGSICSRS
ncbi:MAG: hypothetical protein GH144_01630 [Clostridia bacterium]|jgi:hypothetical protein|nr:hypothetical protein [Clostridia bacterium]